MSVKKMGGSATADYTQEEKEKVLAAGGAVSRSFMWCDGCKSNFGSFGFSSGSSLEENKCPHCGGRVRWRTILLSPEYVNYHKQQRAKDKAEGRE